MFFFLTKHCGGLDYPGLQLRIGLPRSGKPPGQGSEGIMIDPLHQYIESQRKKTI